MPVRNVGSGFKCGHAKNVYKYWIYFELGSRWGEREGVSGRSLRAMLLRNFPQVPGD